MEELDEESGEIVEGYYYARCPHYCKMLIHGANGTDCFIKCSQCGRNTHIVIKEDPVLIEQKAS